MHAGRSTRTGARSRHGKSRRTSYAHTVAVIAAMAFGVLLPPSRALAATTDAMEPAGRPLWLLRFEVGAGPLDRGTDVPGAVLDNGITDGLNTHHNAVVSVSAMHGVRPRLAAGVQFGAATHDLTMKVWAPCRR